MECSAAVSHVWPALSKTGRFLRKHWLLALLSLFVVGFAMTPHSLERMFVYFPSREIRETPGSLGLEYQDVALVTEDRVRLHGWFVPFEGARSTVLMFHGNGGNIADRVEWIRLVHDLGVHVFMIDYRGYGKSEGRPFEEGLYRDARAAYDWWWNERRPRGEKLIVFGESLGGAVAIHLAARNPASGLVLQSTFTSAKEMAKTMYPIGLLLPLTGVKFDSVTEIAKVGCPILLIHGTSDEIVPFRQGEDLYEKASPPKRFYPVPRAGHNDLVWVAGSEYVRQLNSFFMEIQKPPQQN